MTAVTPRFSIIIPTYQRRDVVVASVVALTHQEFKDNFEVIVVVDGSTDGTAQAIRELYTPFPLIVLEQSNQGRATALNEGVEIANGELLLFLDDDMEAHPQLLIEHDRSHREGADMVLGHIPLHPESPSNFLSVGVQDWADRRVQALSSPDAVLTLRDLITGQASLSKEIFQHLGGFDTNFNLNGSFGNEDLDFCYRLQREGYRVVFNPRAISWQKYVVTPRQNLRQYRQSGRAGVIFMRKHPDMVGQVGSFGRESWRERIFWRWLRQPMHWFVLTLLEMGVQTKLVTRLFSKVRRLEYWQGVRETGGIPQARPLRVLCYHSISDLADDPILKNYGVPPDQFRQHLDMLNRFGFHFIDASEFLQFLQGKAGLPRRPVLLTFDDCYQDTLDSALPILKERGIPAIAFAVSQRLGSTNDWDKSIGASQLPLLDAEGLRELVKGGVAIGSHSRTHPMLNRIEIEQLSSEISGSVADLKAIGLSQPLLLAYPHGEYDDNVKLAAQEADIQAAFTVERGLVKLEPDPYQLPRIEILRGDVGWKFLGKVFLARPLPRSLRPLKNMIAGNRRIK
jgi:glycosyltransferase involved in cell wall biosynthesis/peptidoglycan/xylan/chitin deacetylase (PgdA/CDA1 family)